MFPLMYFENALICIFLCSITIKFHENSFHIVMWTWGNLILCFRATQVWFWNKLLFPWRCESCFCVDKINSPTLSSVILRIVLGDSCLSASIHVSFWDIMSISKNDYKMKQILSHWCLTNSSWPQMSSGEGGSVRERTHISELLFLWLYRCGP